MLKYAELRDKAGEKWKRARMKAGNAVNLARTRVRTRIEQNRAEEKRVRRTEGVLDLELSDGWRERTNELNEAGRLEFEAHHKWVYQQDGDFYTVSIETPAVMESTDVRKIERIAEEVTEETGMMQEVVEAELKEMNRDITEPVRHVSLSINYLYAGYIDEESDVQVPTQKPVHRVRYEVDGVEEAEERVQELVEQYGKSDIEELLEDADEKELLA